MVWEFEKFKGDTSIYATCPKCGFRHNPSEMVRDDDGKWNTEIHYQYKYCPMCGEYLYVAGEEISVTWDERDIYDLYNVE